MAHHAGGQHAVISLAPDFNKKNVTITKSGEPKSRATMLNQGQHSFPSVITVHLPPA